MADTQAAPRRLTSPTEGGIDQVLADSFPASDPPQWTPGIARLCPPPPSQDEPPSAADREVAHAGC
jgi:hypothetical protein